MNSLTGRYHVDSIISILGEYSEEDLRKLNHAAYAILNGKRKQDIAQKKRALGVGYTVTFDNGTKTGKIVKINRTKCVVEVPRGGPFGSQRWNVPISMVEVVPPV